jgi:Sec-independent protein secretion pathway component TatC
MNESNSSPKEESKSTIYAVIIVAVLLSFLAIVSQILVGNPVFALYGLATVVPLAIVFLLARNRTKILDEGTESARDIEHE